MTVRGWCPSLFEPMQAGDGWLLRVKPRRAALPAAGARALAAVAARHGLGLALTNRGNVQLRGVAEGAIEAVAQALLRAGLADPDPGAERRRNLLVPPLLGDDPALPPGLETLAEQLEAVLAAPDLAALPGKFGLLLDGGGTAGLAGERADVVLRHAGDAVLVGLDGSDSVLRCAPGEAAGAVERIIRAFLRLRDQARRMRDLIAILPPAQLFGAAGLGAAEDARRPTQAAPRPAAGFLRYSGTARGVLALGLPLGRLEPAALGTLAECAGRHGDGTLRVTPWRSLFLPGIAAEVAPGLLERAAALGLITDPADPRARIVACPGAPACPGGAVPAGADAAVLAAALDPSGLIHLSGCAKGCAHPGPAAFTLVGEAGRYGLVRGGTARDRPERTGLTIAEAAAILRRPGQDAA